MDTNLNTDAVLNQLIDLYSLVFEAIQFKVLEINSELGCFSLKFIHLNDYQRLMDGVRIESLLFGSLEMFSRILINSNQFHQSSSYLLNLQPQKLQSKFYYVEIDYLITTNNDLFLEACCFDENKNMIAKGSTLTLKS